MRPTCGLMVVLLLSACASMPRLPFAGAPHDHRHCPGCAWESGDPRAPEARRLHAAGDVGRLRRLAEGGSPEARYLLAMRLYRGHGVEREVEESMALLRQAAFLDHPAAQHVMGLSYATGDGVERDAHQAARWFLMASELGFAPSIFALGECYRDGVGVDADAERAREQFRRVSSVCRCELAQQARRAAEALDREAISPRG